MHTHGVLMNCIIAIAQKHMSSKANLFVCTLHMYCITYGTNICWMGSITQWRFQTVVPRSVMGLISSGSVNWRMIIFLASYCQYLSTCDEYLLDCKKRVLAWINLQSCSYSAGQHSGSLFKMPESIQFCTIPQTIVAYFHCAQKSLSTRLPPC